MKKPGPEAPAPPVLAGEILEDAARRLAAREIGSYRLDAEVLLGAAMGISRASLLARRDEEVPPPARARFEEFLRRREARVPIAYILGVKEFWSLDFEVNERVLIPRPDTEWVVGEALRLLPARAQAPCELPPPIVADVGTGSGPIAIAIAVERPDAIVHATDLSPEAVDVARRNAARHGVAGRVRFHVGDLLEPLFLAGLEGRIDLLASNPPYVGETEPVDREVIGSEPALAVFAGPEGTAVYERLLPQAARAVKPGGWLVLEIGGGRLGWLTGRLRSGGTWEDLQVHDDYAGLARVVTARRSGAA